MLDLQNLFMHNPLFFKIKYKKYPFTNLEKPIISG